MAVKSLALAVVAGVTAVTEVAVTDVPVVTAVTGFCRHGHDGWP